MEFADLAKRVQLIGRPAKPPVRAAGVHLSGVLQYVAQKIGVLKPDERDEEDFPLIWALGQAWEEYIFSFYPEIDWQPGERTVDGVSVNIDGLGIDSAYEFDSVPWEPLELINEEAKFTFKGVATGAEFIKDQKFWMWRMQAAGYGHVYKARIARWHVCHVRGDYKAFGPVYKQYVVRYSELECKQAWGMVQSHKHLVEPEGAGRAA